MKKAIRLTATLAVLSLAISVLAACNMPFDNSSPTDSSQTDVSTTVADVTSSNTTTSVISKVTTASKTTTATKKEIQSLSTILNLIANYPQGTAGSTMKCVDISLKLINFAQNTTESKSSLEKDINKFYDSLDSSQKELFTQNLYEIDYTSRKLIKGETSSFKQYIEESKETYDKSSYSLSKYENIYQMIANN